MTAGHGYLGQALTQRPAFVADSQPGHGIRTREAVVTEAILSTVTYNDLFGYPPDANEVWRYLHGVRAPFAEVAAQLERLAGEGRLIAGDGCYALPGRTHYFAQRAARTRVAAELWRRARRYAAVLASLPTVRMVSITGSLAVNNTEHDADIDFMLLVDGGTLWRTRAAAMVLQRIERRLTDTLCINYLRSDRALELPQKSLYVAHELLQTVPLYGEDTYREFLAANAWAFEFLPNAAGCRAAAQPVTGSRWLRACAGPLVRSRLAGRFENWECRRKLQRFNHTDRLRGEYSVFGTEATGHRDDVRRRIEGLHGARVAATAAPERRSVLFAQSYHLYFDPKLWREMHPYPPLGSLYGAAVARAAGHDVSFYDSMLATSPNSWAMALDRHRPGVVVLYEDNFNYLTKMCLARMREAALDMIAAAKRIDATVIVCGSDASDNAGVYLEAGADYVIRGEGEGPLGALLEFLDTGGGDPSGIRGISRRGDDGRVIAHPPMPNLRRLDALPFPAWDLVDLAEYRRIWRQRHGRFSLNIVTTRGCPYHCNWCAKPIWGQQYSVRSPEHVVAELRQLIELAAPGAHLVHGRHLRPEAELGAALRGCARRRRHTHPLQVPDAARSPET